MRRSFFSKEKYRELKIIVKTKRIALTIAVLFLEVFVNEFYNIIWQPCCKILTLQTEDGIYNLKKRKILKHN
ncbi:hypothetical protein RIR_e14064_A0A2N1M2A0_9GLOM [Rhizophagus irregularis DAOM 181602=DAOM 197198]|nr:hypothetical protein RIR_e14064_A0A2N1M2A0_9GLOM [Rhizophagus irregularis DAOM 181602=DAOM 197198]